MKLELSGATGRDLEQIFEYGIGQFGLVQARLYQASLKSRLETIANHPFRYPLTEKYGSGIRRSVHRPYAIYYRILATDTVRIMRILSRQNPATAFG